MDRQRSSPFALRVLVATMAVFIGLLSLAGAAAAQSQAAPAAGSMAPAAGIGPECAKDQLALKKPGRLTLSTDNPAYPPWWVGTPPAGSDWALSYPYSGEGYEGATAYAVATALGFTADEIDWLPNAVFENAFAPGPKAFDFHLAQIAINPQRAEAVDFSDPYFDSSQSIVALATDPITAVTTVEGLKAFKLGAAVDTTSLQLIENTIVPTTAPSVFNDNSAASVALQNGQVDGIVVDLYSGIYMTGVELTGGVIAGEFPASVQVDQMGMVLEKGSALTKCVDEAIELIKSNGTLQAIYDQWIAGGQEIPVYQ